MKASDLTRHQRNGHFRPAYVITDALDPIFYVLRFGGLERQVGSFGVMLAIAMLVGASIATRASQRAGLDPGAAIAACGFTVAGALAGATVLYHLVEFFRTGSLEEAFATQGIVFYGAPIGGGLALYYTSGKLELPFWKFVDLGIPGIPLAHAMGRLGCFFGGCCFGRAYEGPFAVLYTHPIAPAASPSIWRHAVPLYESALLLLLGAFLLLIPIKRLGSGARLGYYLAAYAAIRALTETFRGDGVRGLWLGVSTSQWISMGMFALGLYVILRARRTEVASHT